MPRVGNETSRSLPCQKDEGAARLSAKLTEAEKLTLVQGFQTSLADNGAAGTTTPSPSVARSGSDAVAIINARCDSCHSAEGVLQFHASSAGEAQSLTDAMVQQRTTVSAAEEQTLIDYFTR